MVDAHLPEVGHVIRPVFLYPAPAFQVWPQGSPSFFPAPSLSSRSLHCPAARIRRDSLRYCQFPVYIFPAVFRETGGIFSKLVVCQDDAVPVVVLDVMEYSDTLLRRKVLLSRIQYSGIRIGPLERVGYVMHIAFESDNHRFVRQSETFHLKGGHTHDKGLAGSYLMVNYPAAVHLQHPYGISLAVVQIRYPQSFQVKERKTLQGTVIIGTHIAVELAVVHVGKILLELGELLVQPTSESRPNFIDFGIGKLDGLGIPYLYIIAFFILHGFCYVGHRVMQRMFQQVVSVITSFFPLSHNICR